ncbi:MBL fold metallo-hydrolase [Salirhabdus salicampi]|uniref:MBL fold metallo-hydrolase n=1 Tax=Salirhabdus salicampi TaxID=476102 RepID=UPI0020C427AB|nr:MBL fold metallo-hydrolase [Salirhabdus salicampi]MCP8615689.1 MBL fold metallo-hydrolase [Salirhabdus salicampi]
MTKIVDLGDDVTLIDLFDLNMESRTGSYVLHSEKLTIVETSASPSIPYLIRGLEQLNIKPEDIEYVIVTHIHLDHAGGVGLLLEKCPNAKVVVHPRGKRHLADPSKLIAGAKAVYGDKFASLFDPIIPVPEERLITKEEGEILDIGSNRVLTFLDTPGHAKHHFSIFDSYSKGMFTGDTIGVLYTPTIQHGFEFILPSTSPNQFDPAAMLQSMKKIETFRVDKVYFGHYGQTNNPQLVYDQITYWLPKFIVSGEQVVADNQNASSEQLTELLTNQLLKMVQEYLADRGVSPSDKVFQYVEIDMPICAMGIIDYLSKR